ncbi:MAG: deoxynucleoside kinase [Candidatus Beckwithbacteria bacterium]|nr:deoxynucleoside kinase [Candidatus Beckwithbacteria bacterium]
MKSRGQLVVRFGPMWSDKTSWLIRQYGKGKGVVAFKPTLDKRYTNRAVLKSHHGREVAASFIDSRQPDLILKKALNKKTVKVLIDEVNFFDEQLVGVVKELLSHQVDVYAAGLLLDSERRPFGATPQLLSLADEVVEGFAHCDYFKNGLRCEKRAKYTYAKFKKEKQLVVGAASLYGASCEDHYEELQQLGGQSLSWFERVKESSYGKLIQSPPAWLKTVSLPYQRRPLEIKRRYPRIEIGSDSMRIGKTTAAQVLAEGFKKLKLPVELSLEDWPNNPYLKKSYSDPSRGLLQSQKWFIKRKHEQLWKADKNSIWIQDVHPEMDFGYAFTNTLLKRMSGKHFAEYIKYFNTFNWLKAPAPDLLIYLTASDEVLINRAKKTKRKFERVASKYFLLMKAVNRIWVLGTDYINVLMIDTDHFNYSKNGKAQNELTERVVKTLKHLGWKL